MRTGGDKQERESPFETPTRVRSTRRAEQIALATDRMRLRAYMEEGLTEDDIFAETGWSPERLRDLQNEVLAAEEQRLTKMRPEEHFARLSLVSEGNMRILDQLVQDFWGERQIGSLVGAVQAKQKIAVSVLEMGQKMGVIHREPDKSLSIVANLDNEGLKELLAQKLGEFRRLAGEDRHFLDDGDRPHAEVLEAPVKPAAAPIMPGRVVIPRDKPVGAVVRRKAVLPKSLLGG